MGKRKHWPRSPGSMTKKSSHVSVEDEGNLSEVQAAINDRERDAREFKVNREAMEVPDAQRDVSAIKQALRGHSAPLGGVRTLADFAYQPSVRTLSEGPWPRGKPEAPPEEHVVGLSAEESDEELRKLIRQKERAAQAVREIGDWLKGDPTRLEPCGASIFYNLLQEGVIPTDNGLVWKSSGAKAAQLFVVEHNWAAAFRNAAGYDGMEYKLPYDECAFEMKMGGKRLIAFMERRADTVHSLIVRTSVGWYPLAPFKDQDEAAEFFVIIHAIFEQVKAICVALEAGVAEKVLMPAPVGKRVPRESPGYHSLKVRKATRTYVYPDHEVTYHLPLHFRSGHYKHFHMEDTSHAHEWLPEGPMRREPCAICGAWRVWVNWMLVGDSDLGFIDKEYRL